MGVSLAHSPTIPVACCSLWLRWHSYCVGRLFESPCRHHKGFSVGRNSLISYNILSRRLAKEIDHET